MATASVGIPQENEDPLFEELRERYSLEWARAELCGASPAFLWRGRAASGAFSLSCRGERWEVTCGELFPIIDLELRRQDPATGCRSGALPEEVRERVRFPAEPLSQHFFINMIGHRAEPYLGPQLEDPRVRDAILELSDAVLGLVLYRRGIGLLIRGSGADRQSFERDLALGFRIAEALQRLHGPC